MYLINSNNNKIREKTLNDEKLLCKGTFCERCNKKGHILMECIQCIVCEKFEHLGKDCETC